jgi:uncharacterized glyoxalase superfamily protein PhnB
VAIAAASCGECASAKADGYQASTQQTSKHRAGPVLGNVYIITWDVKRLVAFYEPVLQTKAKMTGEDYAEFRASGAVLAIFSAVTQEKYIPGSAESSRNRSIVLEFKVADVDQEYRRLQHLVKVWVKPPTTQPWGTRSIYFRDPDGNLVNFFTPPKPTTRPAD